MTNNDIPALSPQHQSERPIRRIIIFGFAGIMIAAFLAGSNILYGNMPWDDHLAGLILVGISVALIEWQVDYLWLSTVAVMMRNPFSPLGYVSRFPFWYFAGGIGYVLGLLIAKKTNLLTVYDIPVKPLFAFGGIIGIVTQIVAQLLLYRIRYRTAYDTGRTTQNN